MTFNEVRAAIINGELDGHERELYDAIKARRNIVAKQVKRSLRVGDRVQLFAGRLNGTEAKIVKLNKTTATVVLDDGERWRVNMSAMQAVGA